MEDPNQNQTSAVDETPATAPSGGNVAPPAPAPEAPPSAESPAIPSPEGSKSDTEDLGASAGAAIEHEAENLLKSLFESHAKLSAIAEDFAKSETQALHPFISQGVTNLKAELDSLKAILEKCATAS